MAKTAKRSDALGVAVKMEQEGSKYYKKAAKAAKNPLGKKMFLSLAKDEERHEKLFKEMAREAGVDPSDAGEIKRLELHKRMEELFRAVAKKAKKAAKADDNDIKAIDIALGMEEESYKYYTDAAKGIQDSAEGEILRRIADEENEHFKILNDTRLYLAYPQMWYIMQEKPVIDGG